LLGAVVDLLEHSRNSKQKVWRQRLHAGLEQLDVRLVAYTHAGVHAEHLDEARVNVGQWQEQQRGGALVNHLRQLHGGVLREVNKAAVNQFAALWLTGGARGVDDGGEVAHLRLFAAKFHFALGDSAAGSGQNLEI